MAGVRAAGGSLVAWIQREEGFRGTPYQDTRGYWTIGFGRNLDANPLTRDEAEVLLANDLLRAVRVVARLGTWTAHLDEVRWSVLVAMAYQMGEATLRTFKVTLAAIERGDYAKAGGHMLASRWAQQTPERAHRTAQAMVTGQWPVEGRG